MATKEKCIIKGCGNPQKSRGLCRFCYQAASHQVRRQSVTWDELEKKGLAKKTRESAWLNAAKQKIPALKE